MLGAVTVSYNVSGLDKGLKLDGATVADIFLGKVKTWDDAAIAALNPDVKLPGTKITVCHRSDESGTTKNFTAVPRRLLAGVERAAPASTSRSSGRPARARRATTASPAASSRPTAAVGYVEQAYALQNNFTTAAVKNKAGNFVEPTLEATSAAGEGVDAAGGPALQHDRRRGDATYPITAVTFLLVYQDACKAGLDARPAGLVEGLAGLRARRRSGGRAGARVRALPDAIKTKAQAKVDGLECNGGPIARLAPEHDGSGGDHPEPAAAARPAGRGPASPIPLLQARARAAAAALSCC